MDSDNRDKNDKKGLLQQLIELAKVDNDVQEIEFRFLVILAGQLGITKMELFEIMQEHISFHPPKHEYERIIQFQRLCLMMYADGKVLESELNYVNQMGIKMGLHPAATQEVLRLMDEEKMIPVPAERLLEIFRTHHN
jgi:uncharacterized tellurite resistance protein B-like protein